MNIIPAIDLRGGCCVRLFQGDYAKETIYGENPVEQALKWQEAGADIIHLVDLDGAKAGHIVNKEAIKNICSAVSIPCELGGGIRSIEDAKQAFELGVSRVILGTVACEDPSVAEEFIKQFGTEKVVVGIDAKDGKVAIRGWVETSTVDAFALAQNLYLLGVSRIIYTVVALAGIWCISTDIATDGALSGPNLVSVQKLCSLVPDCKIIASGGVSAAEDILHLKQLNMANLEGVIVGKALYDGRATFQELNQAALA